MNKHQIIKRLKQGISDLKEKSNLDLWELGYLEAYEDLKKELEGKLNG